MADPRLSSFLRQRGVPEECLTRMQEDRVDATVIHLMDDASLAVYVPAYGDRLAVRRFCLEDKDGPSTSNSKKNSLLESLKQKMGIQGNQDNDVMEGHASKKKRAHGINNKWARKKTRKIEIGWIHEGKQVRKRRGGGTRTIDVPKETRKADLFTYAKDLFFPEGKNKIGDFESVTADIVDYQEEPIIDNNVTVGELYDTLKMGMLRFYLSTRINCDNDEVKESAGEDQEDDWEHDYSNAETSHEDQRNTSEDADVEDVLSDTSEVIFGPVHFGSSEALQLDDTVVWQPSDHFDDDIIRIASVSPPTASTPDDTSSFDIVLSVNVKIHRSNLLEEMINQFKDPQILEYPLKFTYINEQGSDAAGISRDVYATFWTELLDHAAEGEELRVPLLTPKWQEEEWKSIARILVKGFKDHSYFPCRLAPVFAVTVIFGENEVSDDMLLKNLLLYISQSERDLINTALKEDLDDEDKDELLETLDHLGVKTKPTKENLQDILLKAAHKQLIQKPRYSAEKMAYIASPFFRNAFQCSQDMIQMYDDKIPTTRKFIKLLDASPTTQAESQSLRFLQQYIRGLDNSRLRKMLRFVTGSDVICVEKIEILFYSSRWAIGRRPVAHTCGPTLELPWTYTSYPELRVEMDGILSTLGRDSSNVARDASSSTPTSSQCADYGCWSHAINIHVPVELRPDPVTSLGED
ncbi:hypothetical protein WMY93_017507 [Mugilogobius chulae]|uniref:HECT domain-containing protein n=1 Tax=Mugilogobius chulae TaxID=88201 RepID=A0AAW0NYK7_9GOBI